MNQFLVYFKIGLEHITDVQGYDHILFITMLCVIYNLRDWKKITLLVTAFTLGHSVSLVFSVFEVIRFPSYWIELLIPITILLTAFYDLYKVISSKNVNSLTWKNYLLVLFFGLIHGFGFSNFFIAIFSDALSIVVPLLSFNIGLELGQLVIVVLFILFKQLLNAIKFIPEKYWQFFFIGIGVVLSTLMIINRI